MGVDILLGHNCLIVFGLTYNPGFILNRTQYLLHFLQQLLINRLLNPMSILDDVSGTRGPDECSCDPSICHCELHSEFGNIGTLFAAEFCCPGTDFLNPLRRGMPRWCPLIGEQSLGYRRRADNAYIPFLKNGRSSVSVVSFNE
jgi:hypothetical protein